MKKQIKVRKQTPRKKGRKSMGAYYEGVRTLAEAEEEASSSAVPAPLLSLINGDPPDEGEKEQPEYIDLRETVNTKNIAALVGFLIGVRRELLEQHYSECAAVFEELKDNQEAKTIRYLSKIRTVLIKHYGQVDHDIRYEMKNLPDQGRFDVDNIRELEQMGIQIVQSNYTADKYFVLISQLINTHIDGCRNLFPHWVKYEYIRDIFFLPQAAKAGKLQSEKQKYKENYQLYPFHMYIHWKPENSGLILASDKKFLSVIYSQHGEAFSEFSMVRDSSDSVKNNIYSFIDDANRVAIAVDCENVNPFKLFSVIRGLDADEVAKISKISLYDDVNTTVAWDILAKHLHIPVEHIEVERVLGHKSLVDIKMAVSVTRDFYESAISSFIIMSSDSDFWGLISSLPSARFLVMYERENTSPAILNALSDHGIYHCSIDDFCRASGNDLKKLVLLSELESRLPDIFGLKPIDLAYSIYAATKIDGTKQEVEIFAEKYIKTLKVQVGSDGTMELVIRR